MGWTDMCNGPAGVGLIGGRRMFLDALQQALVSDGIRPVVISHHPERKGAYAYIRDHLDALDLVLVDVEGADPDPLRADLDRITRMGVAVVAIAGPDQHRSVARSLEAGVAAVLTKSAPIDQLTDAVRRICAGDNQVGLNRRLHALADLHSRRATADDAARPFTTLSEREQSVLSGMMDGLSADAIAERDYVAVTTIRSQIRSILLKLDAPSQLAAVAKAYKTGWRCSAQPNPVHAEPALPQGNVAVV